MPSLQGATAMAERDFPTILQDCEPTGDILLQCGSQYDPTTFFVAFSATCASGNVTLQVGRALCWCSRAERWVVRAQSASLLCCAT